MMGAKQKGKIKTRYGVGPALIGQVGRKKPYMETI
jgi:hypothetical protein